MFCSLHYYSEYRSQSKNHADLTDSIYGQSGDSDVPIIVNNNNFARGDPVTLLSFDDAKTLFHEFGHGLHGMLSDVTYQVVKCVFSLYVTYYVYIYMTE